MLDNDSKSEGRNYRSPVRKLMKFFEESRDQWKAKCLQAKYQVKLLNNKVRYLEKRKADLSERVKELEKEIEALEKKKR